MWRSCAVPPPPSALARAGCAALCWIDARIHRRDVTDMMNLTSDSPWRDAYKPRSPRPGDVLGGRYRVEQILGSGGMSVVYRGTHQTLDRPVAIKVVAPHVRARSGVADRFLREAIATTGLKSTHVARVFDAGTTDDGAPFMVMELLEGHDLSAVLAREGPLPIDAAVEYAMQACEALAEVHGLGTWAEATEPRALVGSPRYMPPEQMESAENADARSDIWGIGAVLYELLTGDAPYDGEGYFALYSAEMAGPPPRPSSRRAA